MALLLQGRSGQSIQPTDWLNGALSAQRRPLADEIVRDGGSTPRIVAIQGAGMLTTDAQLLREGLVIGESPRWHDERLHYANWGAGEIVAVDADGGRPELIARAPVTVAFSIDWLADGRMLLTTGPQPGVLRREGEGELVEHVDLSALCGGVNEIVVDSRDRAFVNGGNLDGPNAGIVMLVEPGGGTRTVADGLAFPNGMVLTADERTLIVAESHARQLTAFSVEADGSLRDRRVWADLGDGAPDGLCLDAEGAVWYADVPNKRCVRVAEGGRELDVVSVDRGCFACMLGGATGRTLYIVAAVWRGMANAFDGPPSGQLLAAEAPAPRAGRP
jgi:sugar lactone lactonase YvrE